MLGAAWTALPVWPSFSLLPSPKPRPPISTLPHPPSPNSSYTHHTPHRSHAPAQVRGAVPADPGKRAQWVRSCLLVCLCVCALLPSFPPLSLPFLKRGCLSVRPSRLIEERGSHDTAFSRVCVQNVLVSVWWRLCWKRGGRGLALSPPRPLRSPPPFPTSDISIHSATGSSFSQK